MCKICQSKIEPKVLGKATLGGDSQFDFVVCQNCGTGYLSPAPSYDQLQELYGPHNFGSDWYKQRGLGKAFAKLVLSKKAPGKFLDVGCGLGFFLEGIQKHSKWDVYGVEIAAKAADFARDKLGLDVHQGELADVRYSDGYRNRPDRKQRFKLNFDMEELLSMSPEEGMAFLRQFYFKEVGNYYLGLQPDPPAVNET